jgi:amidase
MLNLALGPATEVRETLARREVSSRELVEFLLARVEAFDPELNAIVQLRAEEALREAEIADRALADGGSEPLLGVPVTVKEAFNVAGMRTTWGNPAFADYVADSDATGVRRLKQAGAIVLGKTNVAFMLADWQTFNDVYGTTNNPWNAGHTAGGSSGGSAAAIASGMSFLELATDLVGSIRIPASFCGVYGLRPSVATVPLTGLQPPGPAPPNEMTYMSSVGPLARSAADLRIALSVTAGPEPPASRALTWSPAPPRHSSLADFRVGFVLDHDGAPVTSDVADVLSNAMDAIARSGATLTEGWPGGVDPLRVHESFDYHVELFIAFQQPGGEIARLSELIDQEHRRMAVRAAWSQYFDDVDVFLCPTNFTPAIPHDTTPFEERTVTTSYGERPYRDQAFWISHPALPGLPAASAPIGTTAEGLPVGLQIIGPLYEDDTTLTFAELLADEIGGYEPPPSATSNA